MSSIISFNGADIRESLSVITHDLIEDNRRVIQKAYLLEFIISLVDNFMRDYRSNKASRQQAKSDADRRNPILLAAIL